MSSNRPSTGSPASVFEALDLATLSKELVAARTSYDTDDERSPSSASLPSSHRQGWVDFNPFEAAEGKSQEDPGLQVDHLPADAEDYLDLALALFDEEPETYPFKVKNQISLKMKMRLVICLCEMAIKKGSEELEAEIVNIDKEENSKREQLCRESYNEALALHDSPADAEEKDRNEAKDASIRGIQRRARLGAEAHELDSKLDQIKTKTRKDLTKPQQSWCTLFMAPDSPSARKNAWKEINETLLTTADQYLRTARGALGNIIEIDDDEIEILLVRNPKTARDFFELAYAIADRNQTYKGAVMNLHYLANAWAIKEKKWSLVAVYLDKIPPNDPCFAGHQSDIKNLLARAQLLQETAAKYSKLKVMQQTISLDQIRVANEGEDAALELFARLCQHVPKPDENKTSAGPRLK
jgi:hypothetical protein